VAKPWHENCQSLLWSCTAHGMVKKQEKCIPDFKTSTRPAPKSPRQGNMTSGVFMHWAKHFYLKL